MHDVYLVNFEQAVFLLVLELLVPATMVKSNTFQESSKYTSPRASSLVTHSTVKMKAKILG